VRPEEEQDGPAAHRAQCRGEHFQLRSGFALHGQQIDVLADALGQGGAGKLLLLAAQILHRFGALAARCHHLRMDFDRGAGGRG